MKIAGYQYQSCFGTFIEEFIREKKEAGFVFIEAYIPCRFYKKAKRLYMSCQMIRSKTYSESLMNTGLRYKFPFFTGCQWNTG